MKNTLQKKIVQSPMATLVLISVVVRVIVYFLLPPSDDFGRYTNSGALYFSALGEHFGDYVSFTTNVPPGTFLIQAAVLALVGPETAMALRAFLILVAVLNSAALVLLFRSALRLGASANIALLTFAVFSIALIPFELWRDGMHYDHLTFFFTSLFAWSLVKFIKNKTVVGNMVWVSVAGALLVSQSAASSAIVPFSVLLIAGFLFVPGRNFAKLFLAWAIMLSLPFLSLFVISKKNQREGQESLTSNKAGPAMMMVVQRSYQYNVQHIRDFVVANGAPEWYLWAYDHPTGYIDFTKGTGDDGWKDLSRAFGICFYATDSSKKNNAWQFDFDPLKKYLVQNGPAALVPIVQADADDAELRPYRFAGFSPELSPRWIGVYGDVSKKMYVKALVQNPGGMLRAFAKQFAVFSMGGPFFMYNTTQNKHTFLSRSGLRTLHEKLPLEMLLCATAILSGAVFLLTYLFSIIHIPFAFFKMFRRREKITELNRCFLLLSIPVLLIAVVYSCLVGGENDRYFMQAEPYLIILATLLPAMLPRPAKVA